LKSIPKQYQDKNFNSMQHVAQTLTASDRNRKIQEMESMLHKVDHLLARVVDESYQGLAGSIQAYSHIVGKVQNSKKQVRALRNHFVSTKEHLDMKVSHLSTKWGLVLQYQQMRDMLEAISYLKSIPNKVEQFVEREQIQKISADLNSSAMANDFSYSDADSTSQIQPTSRADDTKKKNYLHAATLIAAAAAILQLPYPKIDPENPLADNWTHRSLKQIDDRSKSPLAQIPGLVPLRNYLLNLAKVQQFNHGE
jgi:hypothetical protein